jgi:hypothetical protein
MTIAVIELQKECLGASKDLTTILRKAYSVARKLKLDEFLIWTENELNGYSEVESIPNYRIIKGELKYKNPYHGWSPIIIEDYARCVSICCRRVGQSIEELIRLVEKREILAMMLSASQCISIAEQTGISYETKLHISPSEIDRILNIVRNKILDWSLLLEEQGIFGEELLFSDSEMQIAKNSPAVNQYINNFHSSISSVEIIQQTDSF